MLLNTKELYGCKLAAPDGQIGQVRDFFFDDQTWKVRFAVADTGAWFSGRQVLVPPDAFGRFDHEENSLPVNLTRQQIGIRPPPGRNAGAALGRGRVPMDLSPGDGRAAPAWHPALEKPQLRSTHEVTGYDLQAIDGAIGHLRGLMVNDENWTIRILIVEAGRWYAGREILLSARKVRRISAEESMVFMDLALAEICPTAGNQSAPAGRPAPAE